ncbi:hypothetical protein LOZ67_005521 [Ophidiomyces ophidiicola]|nr:hypothetical protein LOZ27_006589 [Ophidiomyces ophidiicola]KAI2192292.1 hypothetical protein LOZ20_004494 [Ophidiomyces ophidiicola]KAI2397402.1 hypothetical protein LOZ67_005521 [Ophidiomyces ophidiicola]
MPPVRIRGARNFGVYVPDPDDAEQQAVFGERNNNNNDDDDDDEDKEEPGRQQDTDGMTMGNALSDGKHDEYFPSVSDVLCAREMLARRRRLPVEIVDVILDHAEYWASAETVAAAGVCIAQDGDAEVLRTRGLCEHPSSSRPLPHRTQHPCRKIRFTIHACDQGWGGSSNNSNHPATFLRRNPLTGRDEPVPARYEGSYSWFDAYRIPANTDTDDDAPDFSAATHFLPTDTRLCSNAVADRAVAARVIEWHFTDAEDDDDAARTVELAEGRGRATLDGRVVRAMGVGDAVSVWARARFPGWQNDVRRVAVRLFWAV